MENKYKITKSVVSYIQYHFVFCPRYRRKVLVDQVKERFIALMEAISKEHQWEVLAVEVEPDYCHLVLRCLPGDSPADIMAKLKGTTSSILRQEFEHLAHLPSIWTRAYFVATKQVTDEEIIMFVESQKKRG